MSKDLSKNWVVVRIPADLKEEDWSYISDRVLDQIDLGTEDESSCFPLIHVANQGISYSFKEKCFTTVLESRNLLIRMKTFP